MGFFRFVILIIFFNFFYVLSIFCAFGFGCRFFGFAWFLSCFGRVKGFLYLFFFGFVRFLGTAYGVHKRLHVHGGHIDSAHIWEHALIHVTDCFHGHMHTVIAYGYISRKMEHSACFALGPVADNAHIFVFFILII